MKSFRQYFFRLALTLFSDESQEIGPISFYRFPWRFSLVVYEDETAIQKEKTFDGTR